ncbi:hypothetical protein LINPERHAP2_LOCUS10584 [Linum perenne]
MGNVIWPSDLFITFTCNSQWLEIPNSFSDIVGLKSEDKPMIVAMVFNLKVKALKNDIQKSCSIQMCASTSYRHIVLQTSASSSFKREDCLMYIFCLGYVKSQKFQNHDKSMRPFQQNFLILLLIPRDFLLLRSSWSMALMVMTDLIHHVWCSTNARKNFQRHSAMRQPTMTMVMSHTSDVTQGSLLIGQVFCLIIDLWSRLVTSNK